MIPKSGIIYYYPWHHETPPPQQPKKQSRSQWSGTLGLALFALSLGGIITPFLPRLLMDTQYALSVQGQALRSYIFGPTMTTTSPVVTKNVFNPLVTPDGASIDPASREFGLVIPKIGVNAKIIPSVNPLKESDYAEALKTGIAHSSLSYFPDQNGTIYLFSHSTNYEWFVQDLNAAFYLLKNLEAGDLATIMYKNKPYTYKITDKRVVPPTAVAYLVPEAGTKRLILETCWPPGSTTERLLLFAEFVEEPSQQI